MFLEYQVFEQLVEASAREISSFVIVIIAKLITTNLTGFPELYIFSRFTVALLLMFEPNVGFSRSRRNQQ